jgi:hypothetical protein
MLLPRLWRELLLIRKSFTPNVRRMAWTGLLMMRVVMMARNERLGNASRATRETLLFPRKWTLCE